MAYDQFQRVQMRKTIYVLLIVGTVVGALAFIFGDEAVSAIRTLVVRPQVEPVTVQLKLFNDANADGEQDPLEPGEHLISYAEVRLEGGQVYTGTASESGEVVLQGVVPGRYELKATLAGSALDIGESALEITTNTPQVLTIAATSATTASGVSGTLLLDSNHNGESDDAGLAGIEMQLRLNDFAVAQTVTNENGAFVFNNVEPGVYSLAPIITGTQLREYRVASIPESRVEIRSSLDRLEEDLLVKTEPPDVSLTSIRFAQASPTAGFSVLKTCGDSNEPAGEYVSALPGSTVHCTVDITPFAESALTLTNVTVRDDFPSIVTPSAVSHGGSLVSGTLEWLLPSVASGTTVTLEYDAFVSQAATDGYYKNTVTVRAEGAQSSDDDATIVVAPVAALSGQGSDGSAGTSANGPGSARTGTTPQTGVGAWAVALTASLSAIAVVTVLVAGYRRTRTIDATTDQS